jgi:hypothetical protein
MRLLRAYSGLGLILGISLLLPSTLRAQPVLELPAGDRPLTVEGEDLYSVGSITGEEWETFSRIAGVAFDSQGNLYILDTDNFRVVKVDSRGGLLSEMGGEGGGPGEFGMPLSFSVTPSGEVRVFDMGQQGFTTFNPDGSFKNTVKMAGGGLFFPSGGLMTHPGGGIVAGGAGGIRISVGGGGGEEKPRPVDLYTLGDELEVTTVYEAWNPLTAVGTRRAETSSAGGVQISAAPQRAFDPSLMVGVLPDGRLAVADSSTYAIKLIEPGQGVVQILRRPIVPRKATRRDQSDERARQLEEVVANTAAGGDGRAYALSGSGSGTSIQISREQVRAIAEQRIEGMEFAEEIPALAEMAADWAGRLWIRRTGPRVGEEGPIDVVTGDGAYLGTLFPRAFEIPDAFGPNGLAAYIERDELGVPTVLVRRLTVH